MLKSNIASEQALYDAKLESYIKDNERLSEEEISRKYYRKLQVISWKHYKINFSKEEHFPIITTT